MEEITVTEDINITLDPVEWYRKIVDNRKNNNSPPHSFIPDGVVNYLAPLFRGYMLGPVGSYGSVPLTAKTEITKDIEEFRQKIAGLDKPAFLYMPLYVPTQPLFRKVDEKGDFVELDPPELLEGGWRIRYAVVGEASVIDSQEQLVT